MNEQKLNFENRKEKLESEISELQSNLESSVNELKSEVKKNLNPVYLAKKHPAISISVAVVLGFLLAGRKKKKSLSNSTDSQFIQTEKNYKDPGLTNLALMELKRALLQKGTTIAVRYIEDFVDDKFGKSGRNQNN